MKMPGSASRKRTFSMLIAANLLLPPIVLPDEARGEQAPPFAEEGPLYPFADKWAVLHRSGCTGMAAT